MNVAPPSWIHTMLNSIDSFCHQLAYKNISVMVFFCCFLNKHLSGSDLKTLYFDFGFLSSPTKNVLLCCVVQQPQRQPGQTNLCCHGNILHVCACAFCVCVCVCVHLPYSWRMTGTVVVCYQLMYDTIHTRTHRTINKTKGTLGRIGVAYMRVCVCA